MPSTTHPASQAEPHSFNPTMIVAMLCVIQVAMSGVGLAQRALDEATRYALERKAFGQPIIEVYIMLQEPQKEEV